MLFYTNRRNNTFGGDLRATDIQRGRDHGLGSYVATRAACGLPVPKTFHEMQDFILAEVHVRRRNDETTDKNILLSKMGTARDQKYFYTLYRVQTVQTLQSTELESRELIQSIGHMLKNF